MKNPHKNLWCLCALVAAWTPAAAFAATFVQTNFNPAGDVDWNNATMWGNNAVTGSNVYETFAGVTPSSSWGTAFTANGTAWKVGGAVRDTASSAFGNSTFNGASLVITANTRLLMKGLSTSGQTSTANIVLNGGFIHAAPNGQSIINLNGTILTQGSLNAIGTNPNTAGNGSLVLNINSTLTGGGTLQLVNAGDSGGTRTSHINLLGDISAFTGLLYLTSGDGANVGVGSDFSIAGSAPLASVTMATGSTNFLFNMNNNNVTFAALTVGANIVSPGVYSAGDLNALPGALGKFSGLGTITVVPEPSTVGLVLAAGSIGLLVARRKNRG